jgi:hypothetical protein
LSVMAVNFCNLCSVCAGRRVGDPDPEFSLPDPVDYR